MKLKQLLKDIPIPVIKGSTDIHITGISANSKCIEPGNLFIAKKGRVEDGAVYIPQAIAAGACAVLSDRYDPAFKQVTQLVHPGIDSIEAALAAQYYDYPDDQLLLVGITGTNGKTTTGFMIKYLLDHFNGPCGLIGTIEYIIGSCRIQATRTTPDVITNYKMLRQMVDAGCRSAVMEVTSHALDQGRVAKMDFDVAIFSNLTLDHLDYHSSMMDYCQAKNRLFRQLGKHSKKKQSAKTALINVDSPWSSQIQAGCQVPILTYGIENEADLRATQIQLSPHGTYLDVIYQDRTVPCFWPLIGRFNVYNGLAAMGALLSRQFLLEEIAAKMETLPSVRGRLEPVINDLGLKIYVDFAHSDDALLNVLECLNEINEGRIITVFGCGGDRDRTKRPKMAEASATYSNITIVTSDNPRSENPTDICREIAKGFKSHDVYEIEIDRRLAIQKAIEMAQPEDIVLIAGKGHEPYQIFAHKTVEFNDVKIAAEICSQLKQLHSC